MLALPGHTSEQRTGNKTKNNHLTGKAPYKFESGSLQGRVCELSVPPETKDPCSELFAKSRAQNWAIWSSGALATLEDKARFAEPAP